MYQFDSFMCWQKRLSADTTIGDKISIFIVVNSQVHHYWGYQLMLLFLGLRRKNWYEKSEFKRDWLVIHTNVAHITMKTINLDGSSKQPFS